MGHLAIERRGDGVLAMTGEIDISTADVLVEATAGHGTGDDLVLDAANVTLIDSTGVQALLRVRDALHGGTLVIRNPSHRVAAVFELVRAETWARFDVEPSLPRGSDGAA
jgi:anti-anti-sigma factor